jgi:formate dehydrogenase subunit gamma
MQASIGLSLRRAALALAWALTCPLAVAQGAAPAAAGGAAPPAGYQVPADPKPDENNAARSQTQPGNNAPFWRGVKESGTLQGFTSLPGAEKGTLIQPFVDYPGSTFTTAGEAWRQVRNDVIIPYGAALLGIMALAVALFYWRRGPIGGHEKETGRRIERFTPLERATHWATAISFVILAVSGLVMSFGKFFLLPILGSTLFGWLTYALKNAHNFAGPVFVVALIIFIVGFARDNLPRQGDLNWLLKAGGLFGGRELPSYRFNGGEKMVFWLGVFLLGLTVAVSGLVLNQLVPGMAYTRGNMQIANMVHAAASMVMMTMFIGHIYMGTVGVKGAYAGMRTGYVDEAWAREHHGFWAEEIRSGKVPAQRSAAPGGPASAGLVPPVPGA